jgi:hypothetical protein
LIALEIGADGLAQIQVPLPMPMQIGEAVTSYTFRLMAK